MIEYVKSINIFGQAELATIPTIPGKGAPNDTIPKETGLLYLDTLSGNLWKCVGDAWIAGEGSVEIDLSNYYTKKETNQLVDKILDSLSDKFASTLYVEEAIGRAIGDISAALDELHAYAEALKGGETV